MEYIVTSKDFEEMCQIRNELVRQRGHEQLVKKFDRVLDTIQFRYESPKMVRKEL